MHIDDGMRSTRGPRGLIGARLRELGLGAAAISLLAAAQAAVGAPWLPVGDRALRSDVELLAAYGIIDGLVTTWPMPRGQFDNLRDDALMASQPDFVQLAAKRVYARLYGESLTGVAIVRGTNSAAVIRDFGTSARDDGDVRVGLDYESGNFDASLRGGVIGDAQGENKDFTPDDTYVAQLVGNLRLYAGWVEHWQGPGADSALLISNNARPFPKIGLMRDNPAAFKTPWLSWLGPVQSDFYVGVLDDSRAIKNPILTSWRLSAAPIKGLELAFSRSIMFCGSGDVPEGANPKTCNPFDAAFHVVNIDKSPNGSNDEATWEMKYTTLVGKQTTLSPYFQFMNEDSIRQWSHLAGLSLGGAAGESGGHWQAVAEYSTSVATYHAFTFNNIDHGEAYRNASYIDGSRYRDRTLGFSLDSDSKLASLSGLFVDAQGWSYRLVYYHAKISTPELAAKQAEPDNISYFNVVSAVPVSFNEIDAGLTIRIGGWSLDFVVRGRDKSLPSDLGDRLQGEAGVTYRF